MTVPRMPVLQLNASLNMSWKKSLSVTSQEKNSLFLIKEKKKLCFLVEGGGDNLVRKKKHTPLVLNGPPLRLIEKVLVEGIQQLQFEDVQW